MAEPTTNGAINGDIEMKEELPTETSLSTIQATTDPTDPLPPPQSQSQDPISHLTSMAPATAALPTASRPTSMPPQPSARPEKPVSHGGPTRQYINSKVTPHLLEGMKHLAVYEPEKPLEWLAEFLRKRSGEVEG